MSKLSKLVRTPKLFFKDAIKKRNKKHFRKPLEVSKKPSSINKKTIKTTSNFFNYKYINKKTHLVIIDDVHGDHPFKQKLVNYQLRSIKKYTDFSDVIYISDSLESRSKAIKSFTTYDEFHSNVVSTISPQREFFVFINLNFIFLQNVKHDSFIDENGRSYTFMKRSSGYEEIVHSVINKINGEFDYNFTPIENFCCIDNVTLNHYYKIKSDFSNISDFIFKFLPVINVLHTSSDNIIKSPVQFAYLSGGYEEKFIWLQSVHGSKKCPIGVTFNKMDSNTDDYEKFLGSIVPHSEKEVGLVKVRA